MRVPPGAVGVAVGQLLGVRIPDLEDLDVEAQGAPGQRVVEVHVHHRGPDLDHCHGTVALLGGDGRRHSRAQPPTTGMYV